ncbi:MAG: hypothetical protein J6Y72_11545 [Bacteroidales bacterium]|jgi:3-hydroxyacyl-[acyl-carrier-protein] dehydratase|nr:hypothetical protein [Bacteroidales bacterium]MBR6252027.1 hypothetical protein [Bacteroidales bacterium]
MLKDSYFRIISKEAIESGFRFEVSLIESHPIYNGHFPGNPVSPGVCSIQMIRECVEEALNKKLSLKSINVCRFITLLTPQKGVHLQLEINLTDNNDSVDAKATISDDGITYVSYKGTFGLK